MFPVPEENKALWWKGVKSLCVHFLYINYNNICTELCTKCFNRADLLRHKILKNKRQNAFFLCDAYFTSGQYWRPKSRAKHQPRQGIIKLQASKHGCKQITVFFPSCANFIGLTRQLRKWWATLARCFSNSHLAGWRWHVDFLCESVCVHKFVKVRWLLFSVHWHPLF